MSDNYLKFLVFELKPFIDATYRTLKSRKDTFIMGSSMGALISAYAMSEYPHIYGGAGCVSTHWPVGDGIVIEGHFWSDHWHLACAEGSLTNQRSAWRLAKAGAHTNIGAKHNEHTSRVFTD